MKHAGSDALLRSLPLIEHASGERVKRKNLFKQMIEALHLARGRQARHLIRRYRHLLTDDFRN